MDPSTSTDAAAAAAGGLWALMSTLCCFAYLIPIGLGIAGMVLWIVTIIDVAQRPPSEFPHALKGESSPNEQIVWVLVVVLTGVIGAIVYWAVVMRRHPRSEQVSQLAEPVAAEPPVAPPPSHLRPSRRLPHHPPPSPRPLRRPPCRASRSGYRVSAQFSWRPGSRHAARVDAGDRLRLWYKPIGVRLRRRDDRSDHQCMHERA